MWPRFWLFLLSKNCKWEYLGTKHEEINCNIYLSCVPEGIFPWYISSADWETVGSWPRLATASTLSSLERSCDCDADHVTDVDHVTVMWVIWQWVDHVTDVGHVTVMWVIWLWCGLCDCDVGHVTVIWITWLWHGSCDGYGSCDCDVDHMTDRTLT